MTPCKGRPWALAARCNERSFASLRMEHHRSIELTAALGELPQRRRGIEALAMPEREVVEPRLDVWQSQRVGVPQQAPSERRETGAHDHGQVELRRGGDDLLVEDHRR